MQDQLQLYFQVHSPIPAYQGHLKEALVTLSSEEEHIQCIAFRLEGGEKLLMPDSIRDKIIALLLENKPVTIELEGYKTTFQPADFKTHFKKLKHPFPISNPFRLPF